MSTGASVSWRRWIFHAVAGATAILILLGVVTWCWLGSFDAARAFIRGDDLVVIPSFVDFGNCAAGDVEETQLRIVNMSSAPITLTGVYTSCSCILVDSLPVTVEAHASFPLLLTIHSPEVSGDFSRRAVIYTTSKTSPQLPITLLGRAIAENNRAGANTTAGTQQYQSPAAAPTDNKEPTAVLVAPREPDLASFPSAKLKQDSQ